VIEHELTEFSGQLELLLGKLVAIDHFLSCERPPCWIVEETNGGECEFRAIDFGLDDARPSFDMEKNRFGITLTMMATSNVIQILAVRWKSISCY
jgi:hypothetical protein